MQKLFVVAPALMLAGGVLAQNVLDPEVKVPPTQYRSAFEGYKPFAEQDLADWRKANDDVRAAGGHAGHRPGQGPGKETSKPQPGKPEMKGHGGHK